MSLDTVLKIGKALRSSEDNLKYFKYVEPCPCKKEKDGSKTYPICFTIPVNNDFTFNWDGLKLTPENERDKLFYLKFKTSDSDSSPNKYLFGDISYSRKNGLNKKGQLNATKDFGNFTLERGNAFFNAANSFDEIELSLFENEIIQKIDFIDLDKDKETILKRLFQSYKNDTTITLPQKYEAYNEKIRIIYEQSKNKIKCSDLIMFKEKFRNDIDSFITILKYAPIIDHLISENQYSKNTLKDIDIDLKYASFLVKHLNNRVLKNFLSDEDTIDNITDKTLKRLSVYCDYNVYLHFDFKGKSWYELESTLDVLSEKLNSEITNKTEFGEVPSKAIYRTLCSGNDKNDIQFPNFDINSSYKSFHFRNNEFIDFLHSGLFTKEPLRKLNGTSIEFFILPVPLNNENAFNAEMYEEFLKNQDEARIKMYSNEAESEPLFAFFDDININFTKFDFIFTDGSGNAKNDLIEISGLEKSKLKQIAERIKAISNQIKNEKKQCLRTDKEQFDFKIENSFKNVLGNYLYDEKTKKANVKVNPKYQSHILKVVPQIYTESYFHDEILLPAFIQNVENTVRFGDPKYIFLKFDLKFLLKIRNNKNDIYMEITNSKSYKIGLLLGGLAKNLAMEINSFEKNYVGNLNRRITYLDDFIKLKNDIEQKLIMHDKSKFTFQNSYDLAQEIKDFTGQYDKEECAFGFLESYFKPIPKKENKE